MSRHPAWLHKGFGWIARHTRLLQRILKWIGHLFRFLRVLKYLNPFRYIKKIDWYIIRKFIGTYFFSIALIISISIVFDVNENLAKFTQYHAPLRAIVFDYYANFIPYFANLFSALFVFIAVIFFTSKMAGNSEIIAMLATGISFKRLLRPYMFTCVLLAGLSYYLSAYVIPHGTVIRQNFETMYKNKKRQTAADNVQLQVGPGVIAYIQHYDDTQKQGYGFCLDRFKDKKLISHLTAITIQYDTISDNKFHWKLSNWKIRQLKGLREHITTGDVKDTIIQMEPMDLVYSKGQQETFTSPALRDYISKQINRGSGGGVSQTHCLVFRLVHPDDHRRLALSQKTQGRHGHVLRHRTGTELYLYHVADRFGLLRHQRGIPAHPRGMDAQPDLHRHRTDLLPASTELMYSV